MSDKRRIGCAITLVVISLTPPALGAEEEPNGRGIVGGTLLGAELAVAGEAVFLVEPSWAYFVGGAVGGGVGAYAGYLVEENAQREVSLVMLAAGVALVIPTAIFVANLTEDKPPPPESVQLLPPSVRVDTAARGVSLDFLNGRF